MADWPIDWKGLALTARSSLEISLEPYLTSSQLLFNGVPMQPFTYPGATNFTSECSNESCQL